MHERAQISMHERAQTSMHECARISMKVWKMEITTEVRKCLHMLVPEYYR